MTDGTRPEDYDPADHMSAAECRERAKKTWTSWEAELDALGSTLATPDERAIMKDRLARLSVRARRWEQAAEDAEKRERGG